VPVFTVLSNVEYVLEANLRSNTFPTTLSVDLRLGRNKFRGDVSFLGQLSDIETVDLSENEFSGSIPDMFDQIFRLREFMVQNNKLTSSLPRTITHLSSMSKSFSHFLSSPFAC
jgi:hypothetical protein